MAARLFTILAAAATVAASSAAVAQPNPQPNTQRPRAANPERVVCKRDGLTGSRFPRRVCKTQAEWDGERDQQQDSVRDYQRDGSERAALPNLDGGPAARGGGPN